jgi:hypothetical protein
LRFAFSVDLYSIEYDEHGQPIAGMSNTIMSFAQLLLVGAATADRFGLRPDWPLEGLRPLESLALCGNATYKPLCDRAARFRALMQQRPRAPPRALPDRSAAPLRVHAVPPSWLTRGAGGPDVACEVPCA